MKFGKQLEEYEVPEWRGHYIPYKKLKTWLEDMAPLSAHKSPPASPLPFRRTSMRLPRVATHDDETPTDSPSWLRVCEYEGRRVGEFVDRGFQGLSAQLDDLARMADELKAQRDEKKARRSECATPESFDNSLSPLLSTPAFDEDVVRVAPILEDKALEDENVSQKDDEDMELRLLDSVGRVSDGVQRLKGFAELNHAALYKILKKHDKLLKSHEGLGVLFPKVVEATQLGDTARMARLTDEVKRLSLESSQTQGLLNASSEVARLAAGLGQSRGGPAGGHMWTVEQRNDLVMAFFIGCFTALFLSIAVLLALPVNDDATFSEAYFLTSIPVFRVVFSVLLSTWCLGGVARTCDRWDINHMFMLRVDPRCSVSPGFFFKRAAILTTVWILLFGMYVVDYKWELLPTIDSDVGFNGRSSLHFVFYPLVVFCVTITGFTMPSKICRNRYKASLLRSLGRTLCAPCFTVDFADNILGDVLTSVAKALQDVPAAMCYLASPHPQTSESLAHFLSVGDCCGFGTHKYLLPCIVGLPYWCRAMQCLRRHRDTKEVRHLWNFGKYVSCLLVVVVGALTSNWQAIAPVSAIATFYCFYWDVALDWGLCWEDFFNLAMAGSRVGRETEVQTSPHETASNPISPARAERPQRHFPPWVYWLCLLLDLVARLTWILTLIPIKYIAGGMLVLRVTLTLFISSVEILRRSMWAVLRIEYEQIANASGYRALLWVPSKLNKEHNHEKKGSSNLRQRRTPSKKNKDDKAGTTSEPLLLAWNQSEPPSDDVQC